MNDGFLSLILSILYLFILLGGWIDKDLQEERLKKGKLASIFIILLIAPFYSFQMLDMEITLASFAIIAFFLFYLFRKDREERFTLLSGSLLIGATLFLLEELFLIDPVLLIFDERIIVSAAIGILTGFISASLANKWVMTMLGILVGFALFTIHHYEQIVNKVIGSFFMIDLLFLSFLCISIIHISFQRSIEWFDSVKRKLRDTNHSGRRAL